MATRAWSLKTGLVPDGPRFTPSRTLAPPSEKTTGFRLHQSKVTRSGYKPGAQGLRVGLRPMTPPTTSKWPLTAGSACTDNRAHQWRAEATRRAAKGFPAEEA